MNEDVTSTIRQNPDGTLVEILQDGSIRPISAERDLARLQSMTEEEVEANARSDPDNLPLTDNDLEEFRRLPNPRDIRNRMSMTQADFATIFEIPLGTLRDWEQGRRQLDAAAQVLLRVIEQHPDVVLKSLEALPGRSPGIRELVTKYEISFRRAASNHPRKLNRPSGTPSQ